MILTDKERMVLTPTYHVFDLYKVHQGSTLVPLEVKSPSYEMDGKSIPAIHATASRGSDGKLNISLVNLDATKSAQVAATMPKGSSVAKARIVTADRLNAHNTFDHPDVVKPASFTGAKIDGETLTADLPAKSVVVIEIRWPS